MGSIVRGLLLMSFLACGSAMAVDPTDEDVSYLPQNLLENMTGKRYGYDKAAYRKCLAAHPGKAAGAADEATCRLKATPKKCRELSAQPGEKGSKSAQEICADKCWAEGAQSAGKDACSLN